MKKGTEDGNGEMELKKPNLWKKGSHQVSGAEDKKEILNLASTVFADQTENQPTSSKKIMTDRIITTKR
jgi:hypothetical protein